MLRLILGAVMISFSAVWVKLVHVAPTTAAFYRMFLGGCILAVIVLARRERFGMRSRAMPGALAAGFFFALDLIFWHRSILYVGPGLATLLANFQVFILALAGLAVFGEVLTWRLAIAIPLALAGLTLLVAGDWAALGPDYHLGVMFGLITAVCYAAYTLTLRTARVSEAAPSPYATMATLSLICAAILALVALGQGESLSLSRWTDAGWLLAYGIAGQVLGWVLISGSLETVPASTVGLVLLLQPTLAFVWDVLFFGRQLGAAEVSGALIALAAIYLGSQRHGRRAAET
ncbi:MAG: DMT family transporter [Gammaproteobacteria bacterium]